ncbi:MAG: ArnT family glycosyltransferase [Lentimonas sp.]
MHFLVKHPRLILILASALYLLPGIHLLPLLDRDEPRFSRATVEMMDRDNWVVPYFNNEYRFDKPPLTYWWMSVNYRIFGVNEAGARLHSVICVGLIALLVFAFARRSGLSPPAALLAGFIWISSLQIWIHGRLAVADMPLILGITMTLLGVWGYLFEKKQRGYFNRDFWLIYLGLTIGFLSKGPLAFLIPGITLGLFAFLTRKHSDEKAHYAQLARSIIAGLPITLGLVAAWGIPALVQTEGAFFNVGIGEHVIERGVTSFNERLYIPGVYYLVAVLVFFSPWVATLWPSIQSNWKQRKSNPRSCFLLSWGVSSFLVFSMYKTQLPHYVLPSYPALALMAAGFLQGNERPRFHLTLWINRIILAVLMLLSLLLAIVLWSHATLRSIPATLLTLAAMFALLLTASEFVRKGRIAYAIGALTLSALSFLPLTHFFRGAHITVALNDQIVDRLPTTKEAYGVGFAEPSLVWYSDRFWNFSGSNSLSEINLGSSDLLVFNTRRWRMDEELIGNWLKGDAIQPMHNRREAITERFAKEQIQWVTGFSPGNSSWIELAVITNQEAE